MDSLSLHPESKIILNLRASKPGAKAYYECDTVNEARAAHDAVFANIGPLCDAFEATTRELFVPSPQLIGGIPIDVYTPREVSADPAILVFYHGGGLVVGTRRSTQLACMHLAQAAKCIVVNVEYRLAPEHKFPAMIDDACCVAEWVKANKVLLGGSERSRIGVAGDSGGGNIAASVCHECTGVNFQILIYPHVSARGDYSLPSYQEFIDGPLLDRKLLDWFVNLMAEKTDWANPRLAPLLREEFSHLPPALFIVAEIDPLRDDSYEYAKKLSAAGVHSELHLAKGALHAFYTVPFVCKELTREAYAKTVDFIHKFGRV
ncbi:hypothetical protein CAPTEDRAFT_223437 [Capitella teleta]|uniref:Alpha/beta hydrolase fold-3 domain-containing protein n=1 Tax=Capitella teleta TaxID=283909 RepID=R7TIX6_CAPTE|nr:hypothetical protein CAPTEDRAFT_223437 [Capitella teleta]|eukprot:ELT91050.1 hypothetical protein CAPTEDRAFT_223437 [Capitella teleta]